MATVRRWPGILGVAVAGLVAAAPARAQAPAPAAQRVEWAEATPEVPPPPPAPGAAPANPPVEGPTEPGIKEVGLATRHGMPVLLYFWWPEASGPGTACRTLDIEIFRNSLVVQAAKPFACLRVNTKTCPPAVLKKFGIATAPTVLVLTCDRTPAATLKGASKDPEAFAAKLEAAIKRNEAIVAKQEAQRQQFLAAVRAADALRDQRKFAEATKAYEKVIVQAGATSAAAEDARWGMRELKMIQVCDEGEKLFEAGKYYEARGRLQVAFDFEVACDARDRARKLLPECEMGVRFTEACALAAQEGKGLEGIHALEEIVKDETYQGKFRALAEEKLKAIREGWGK